MDPLSVPASIVALLQLSSIVIGYLSDVKGGPRELQRLRLEVCNILPILSILQDEAEQAKSGGRWSSTLLSLDAPNGPIQCFRAALEQLETRLAPAQGWKKVGKAFTWPFKKEEILEILDTIERQKLLFTLARQNDHIALTRALKADFEIVHNKIDETVEEVTRFELNDRHHKVRLWLSGVDPSLNYNRALVKRHQGTGHWLIEDAIFRDWKQNTGSDSIIWLYGIPGCGKTILCSTVIEHVLHARATTPDIAVLYFFFDFNDTEKQQHESMMRSLLSQLSMHFVRIPTVLETLYSSCMEGGRKPNFEALKETLHKMTTAFRAAFIILDALDECRERPELLTDIEEMSSWEDTNLRILATSRREKEIENSILGVTKDANRICIQSALVNADIRAYVHGQLRTNRRLQRWQKQPNVQSEIENTLMEKANGMFRWVACQLDVLGKCLTLPKLRKTLATLPKTLDDTYARIICSIDDEYQQYALHILQWLAFSMRPLHLKEIAEVVAIDINDNPNFDPQRRLSDPEDVVEICSSLITVTDKVSDDDELNCLYPNSCEAYVALAHFSVKEYLTSDSICHGKAVKFHLDETECHVALIKDCLAYLFHFDKLGFLTSDVFAEYPLAQYAAMHLPEHAQIAEKKDKAIYQDLFLTKGEAFRNWVRLHDVLYPIALDNLRFPQPAIFPLHCAWEAGFFESVRVVVTKGPNCYAQKEYGNALIASSYIGNTDLVKLLLEERFHLDTASSFYGVALRTASCRGHTEVVQTLLERGPAENERANLALRSVIENCDENKARSWLEGRADINWGDYADIGLPELALQIMWGCVHD